MVLSESALNVFVGWRGWWLNGWLSKVGAKRVFNRANLDTES